MTVLTFLTFLTGGPPLVHAAQQPSGRGAVQQPSGRGTAPQTPARDTAGRQTPAQPTGTARITGKIYRADTGRPLRNARVLLGGGPRGGQTAVTDDSGAFSFTELDDGRYTLSASKTGFVTLAYGQRRPLQPGIPLQVATGQALTDLELRLPRGSALGGTVVDETGEPMPGILVSVLRQQYVQGQRQLVTAGTGQTDDRGQYRIWGLNPGEYYVSAVAPNVLVAGILQAIGGRGDNGGRGGAAAQAGGGGDLRGRAIQALQNALEAEPLSYAPTYYPGVSSSREARPVTVGLSADVLGTDFGLLLVRMARVSGRVSAADGGSVSGTVTLASDDQAGGRGGRGGGLAGGTFGSRIQDDGTFVITNVPPGQYVLRARSNPFGRGGRGGGGRGRGFQDDANATADAVPRFAAQPLNVSGDITGLNVVLAPGGSISGSLVLQATGSTTRPNPNQIRIVAQPVDPSIGQATAGRVEDSGQFTIEGIPAGQHWLRVQGGGGLLLESVTIGGRDVTDVAQDIAPGEKISGATVVLSNRLSEINGTVTDDRGAPVTDYTVLAFPEDDALWGPASRHILTARPDQNGKFQIRGLPASRYYLVAIDPTSQGEWFDPAFLQEHRDGAARVALGKGEIRTQDFRLPSR